MSRSRVSWASRFTAPISRRMTPSISVRSISGRRIPVGRSHAVQYHSLPVYTWQKLRTDQPGKYEQAVNPVPDPNAWFHARIVVANPKVSVFVGDAKEPSLVVNMLNDRRKGSIGLWVGN